MKVTATTLFDPTDIDAKVITRDTESTWEQTLSMCNVFAEECGEVLIRLPGSIIFMHEQGRITRFDHVVTHD